MSTRSAAPSSPGCAPTEESRTDLTTYDDWRAALADVTRLSLEGVGDDDLRALWSRVERAHRAWDAAGRP